MARWANTCCRNGDLRELVGFAGIASLYALVGHGAARRLYRAVAFLLATRGHSRLARDTEVVAPRSGLAADRHLVSFRVVPAITFAAPSRQLSHLSKGRHGIVLP